MDQRVDYTFKFNQNLGRHGWLRLTPAYSVKLVNELISKSEKNQIILDPFSGTATTGLVAAEMGHRAVTCDINPFLIWLGNLKCSNFSLDQLSNLWERAESAISLTESNIGSINWRPSIFNIERWWNNHTLAVLAALRSEISKEFGEPELSGNDGLVWVAFCRLVIETSSAAFNHQSMSFSENLQHYEVEQILDLYKNILKVIIGTAKPSLKGSASVVKMDARTMKPMGEKFTKVVTSPPYPNRMSYIRELRPYMYWTRFLHEAKEAGELDWQAIGGTWGIASSRLNDWFVTEGGIPDSACRAYEAIKKAESKNNELLATYVLKYFHDMHMHFAGLRELLSDGASIHYIVGNSTFFGNMVDSAKIFEESLKKLGYAGVYSDVIRKRSSKKELFEYCVNARWVN